MGNHNIPNGDSSPSPPSYNRVGDGGRSDMVAEVQAAVV